MIKTVFKSILTAIIFGIVASLMAAVLNKDFHDVIGSFAMGLSCYLLVIYSEKG